MKVFINGTNEITNIGSVVERLREDTCVLDININDSELPPDELQAMFADITEVKVIRNDLNGEEQTAVFTEYTQVDKIQRKISEETDITLVSLVRADAEGGADNG